MKSDKIWKLNKPIEKLGLARFVEVEPTDETDYHLSRDIVMIEKKVNEVVDFLNKVYVDTESDDKYLDVFIDENPKP